MNANEILNLISKHWCNSSDLEKITGLGKNSISKIKTNIRKELVNKGYKNLPKKLLPMKEVIDFLQIDINYLESIKNKTDY